MTYPLMLCESCGVLVTHLSTWCDCTKGRTGTQKLRPLTKVEWGFIQDEPPDIDAEDVKR
jgi:hypothetical protein